MATKCICYSNEPPLKVKATAGLRATCQLVHGNPLRINVESKIRDKVAKDHGRKIRIQGAFKISDSFNHSQNIKTNFTKEFDISRAFATADSGVLRSRVDGDFNVRSLNTKFGGYTSRVKLTGFQAQEKLFPSGDHSSMLAQNSGMFVNSSGQSPLEFPLASGIDEGVFTGDIFKSSTTLADEETYITPYVSGNYVTGYQYSALVNPLMTKAEESFFVMQALGPLTNQSSATTPLYKLTNIKLIDPNGDLVIQYKDLSFKGDGYYTTYFSEPITNPLRKNTYDVDFPGINIAGGSYRVSFDLDIECLDDPFNQGFNVGYEELSCEVLESPIESLRISALEIQNSGSLFPVDQNRLNFFMPVPPTGDRLLRYIYPKVIAASGYQTTIFPEGQSRWKSNTYLDSVAFENSGEKPVDILTQRSNARYLTLEQVSDSIPDSGKLVLRFEDKVQNNTFRMSNAPYNRAFNFNYGKPKIKVFTLQDTFYTDIDQIKLIITARKAEGSRNFALDVVGYSDDKLLAVTSPSGGFLQSVSGVGNIPSDITQETFDVDRSFSDGSISDGGEISITSQAMNSGGDHYILTQTPLINSTLFKEYEIPLEFHDLIPTLGRTQRFNQSTFFEKLYLDLYPIPSGAEISEIKLEVRYRPGNAIPMSIIGHQGEHELSKGDFDLSLVPHSDYANPVFNKGDLASFGTLPHTYTTPDNIKTNYSRRWRGVAGGKQYFSPFKDHQFDFSYEKDEKRHPFIDHYYDFSIASGNYVVSKGTLVGDFKLETSGLFSSNLSNSIYDHVGWRFNSSGLLNESSQTYKTTAWASGSHPLVGKIADAFNHTIRVSGTDGYVTFDNASPASAFTALIRFTPDETVSGVTYNQFNSGVLFGSHDLGLRYSGDYLQAYINTAGGEVNATDTVKYTSYSYPLAALVSYDGTNLKLYTENEITNVWNQLRASAAGTKTNAGNDLYLGSGMNMFVSEFGIVNSGLSLTDSSHIDISEVFNQTRMTFDYSRDSLVEYINQDADTQWMLNDFRHCHFNHEFNRFDSRGDTDYIEHTLHHDGLPYSSKTNLTLPTNINTTDLAYHTQIENDFLRFYIEDVPNIAGSGKFYSADVRISKNLPRGYNFKEDAIAVETVIDADSLENIVWPNEDIGPKLIVSLYAKTKADNSFEGVTNFGLINRHIHSIALNDCFRKIKSVFNYDNLIDNSEPWADFLRPSYLGEFENKYLSDDINDMFLQYDIAYPKHATAFDSYIRIHSAEIKLNDALIETPTATDTFNLYASGEKVVRETINFSTTGSVTVQSLPSGLATFTVARSGNVIEASGNLYVSGRMPDDDVNLYVKGHEVFDSSSHFGSLYGDHTVGLNIFVQNNGEFEIPASMGLTAINTDSNPSGIGSLNLTSFSKSADIFIVKNSLPLNLQGPSFITSDIVVASGMNLTTRLSDVFISSNRFPFNLTVISETPKLNDDLSLYTINAPLVDTLTDQKQAVLWDGSNFGESILVAENDYSALSADDEIRGVTTICFGDCDSGGICRSREIMTHGVDWNTSSCVHGGIARAQTTYTNTDTVAFGTDTDGYQNHFYGIRKYTGLIPMYPYTVTMHGYTGSTELIDIPPKIDTVGFGASDEVNYSGIKHVSNDLLAASGQFGKAVAMDGDLMAIGAPNYALTDNSGTMKDCGAVFLYRRSPEASGHDWSAQEDQAGWKLEQVLTLPDGFKRDYSYIEEDIIGEPPDASYKANVRKWVIGQNGRNFGYSLDIASDRSDESKDIVVVGAPRAKFDRDFGLLPVKQLNAVMIVVSDNLDARGRITGDESRYEGLERFIVKRNRYFKNIANPAFEINPTYIILSATANLGVEIEDEIQTKLVSRGFSNYRSNEINRLISPTDLAANSLIIENQIKDIFNAEFPPTAGLPNSGMPVMMGLFVDNSNSLGRYSVEPAIDNFKTYFQEYTFGSGLVDVSDNPASGLVIETTKAPDGEEWILALNNIIIDTLKNETIANNTSLFTSSFDPLSVPTSSGYNDVPTSGGRVYIFEKENATSGLFYSSDQQIWNMSQEIGLDRYLHDTQYHNERFGHAVSISKDTTKVAVGSPYEQKAGVRVYEKQSYNLNHYYDKVGDWATRRVEENVDDVTSIYYKLLQTYNTALSEMLVARSAGKFIYDQLDPSGRFDLRLYCETYGGGQVDKYKEIFQYKNDYNYNGGRWDFVPKRLAARPRVGYSVSLNDDGNLLAVGCPTDSMNQHDDSNVWHRNTKLCSEDNITPGYNSPLAEEAYLVTGKFSDGGDEGTFQSYVNAGAVQLFDSRRYYPHNKAIEYGIFGNQQKSLSNVEDQDKYFDLISGVYNFNTPFQRTDFTDPEIPQDAGIVFITTPEIDSLSEEVLENIVNWLNYGDRNLVLVGNDPTWEENGAYKDSNDILNKILTRLGSRMRLHSARNKYHSLADVSGINTISATVPEASYDTVGTPVQLKASGVADIRLHEPSFPTRSHSCSEDFALANMRCQPDIRHEGDLRAQWYDMCSDIKGNCVKIPRNIQTAYGILPGFLHPTAYVGHPCDKPKDLKWKVYTENLYKAPTPILAAAEAPPLLKKTIPEIPASTREETVCVNVPDANSLYLANNKNFIGDKVFSFVSSGNSDSYSGVFTSFETNFGNTADAGCEWFKPKRLSQDYVLQSSGTSIEKSQENQIKAADIFAWCADTSFNKDLPEFLNGSVKESFVTLISTVAIEEYNIINAGRDEMLQFYNNLITKRLETRQSPDTQTPIVKIAQLGGWTNRNSFKDGYKDSYLDTIFGKNTGPFGGLGNPPRFPYAFAENVVASDSDDLIDYDICWIANTDVIPSDEDVKILRDWLMQGNKRLVITYGSTPDGVVNQPSDAHANATLNFCEKLGLDIKPLYLPHKRKFAKREDRGIIDVLPVVQNDKWNTPWNENHPMYSEGMPTINNIFAVDLDSTRITESRGKLDQTFIPIETSRENYVALFHISAIRAVFPYNVIDKFTTSTDKFYINSGWSRLSVELPDIENSGYFVEVNLVAEDPSELPNAYTMIRTANLALGDRNKGQFTKTHLGLISHSNKENQFPTDNSSRFVGASYAEIVTSNSKTITLGPFWATDKNAHIYIAVNNFGRFEDRPFNSPRIASIFGYPAPLKTGFRKECTTVEFPVPAVPSREVVLSPPLREISTSHEIYCPSQDDGCLDLFKVPYNDRKPSYTATNDFDPSMPESILNPEKCGGAPLPIKTREAYMADFGSGLATVDGPVIVAQEIWIGGTFSAGVERSRITVIADSSLVQGKMAYDELGNKNRSNVNFVNSLYPYTSFPDDIIYNTRYKITCPERGSPFKWYSATGNSGLIDRFAYNAGDVTPLAASNFRDNENLLDPNYIPRPKGFCECDDTVPPCDVAELQEIYINSLKSSWHPFSQFSTTINGKKYRDDGQLLKDTGYDYLDFEAYDFNDGYPGDLFGFSVKLTNNRLFIGTPFSVFNQEDRIVNWSSISGTPAIQVPSGVEVSSHGGAGAVYMFEKNLKGGQYIKNKNGSFIRQSGSLDWGYVKKFRPDSINVGQDLTSMSQSLPPSSIDSNNYSTSRLRALTPETDKFGFSLAIDSGVLVVGAPGHDFGNFVDAPPQTGMFMSKAFNKSFVDPSRDVYDQGTSGIRMQFPESGVTNDAFGSGIKFGATVLNNGAAFVYTEDYDYSTESYNWSFLEKIVPEGVNTNRQYTEIGPDTIPFSGAENSRFGSSVAIHRTRRVDSDYSIVVGSKDHPFASGNDLEERKEGKGASYTYDLILRKQPPATADSGAFIHAKLFAESGAVLQYDPILLNITNSGLHEEYFENTGIIYSNSDGEFFLEVSGQDQSTYQYIKHRPWINAVDGAMVAGTKVTNGIRMFVEGRPNESSGNMNLMALGADSANVYNDIGLRTFGVTGLATGDPSGLFLFNNAENPSTLNASGNLYVSGNAFQSFESDPSGLVLYVSGIAPQAFNSADGSVSGLNVFVNGIE